jgi:hypothetical protein
MKQYIDFSTLIHVYIELIHNVKSLVWRCNNKSRASAMMCNHYNAQVGWPPIGAEDEEGFNVGDQALGNLRAGGRVTACQPPNLLQLTFKHGGSASPATAVDP